MSRKIALSTKVPKRTHTTMCTTWTKIKSKNDYNKKFAYIQCGLCAECRATIKSQWQNRLHAEIEHYHTKKGYNVGFITLTYREEYLPHIPKKFFKENEYKRIPCFSYEDILQFTTCIRNYLWKKKSIKEGFRWLITCEYGEKKHRPHMHGLLLFHPSISHEEMYKLVEDAWCGTTNLIPNNPKHKTEKRLHKGKIAPFEDFVPRDNYACGSYVAKYICKDIEFHTTTIGLFNHLTKKQKNELRHYQPFHKQSMGFGSNLLHEKTDNELLEMLENGFDVTGSMKKKMTPQYLRNKILYTTQKKYNLKTHKHETIKKYTPFLYRNIEKVYDIQIKKNKEMFEQMRKKEYWEKNPIEDFNNIRQEFVTRTIEKYGSEKLADFYTNYYGLPQEKCKEKEPWDRKGLNILMRYNPCANMEDRPNINTEEYKEMTQVINFIMDIKHMQKKVERTEEDEKIEKLRKFWQETMGKTT